MSVIELNKDPTDRELTVFGVLLGLFAIVLGALLSWRMESFAVGALVWTVGAALVLTYWTFRPKRRVIYRAWILACFPVAWLVAHLLLGTIYYLVITPFGVVMRLVGHDPMTRNLDENATTYWVSMPAKDDSSRYFRQS